METQCVFCEAGSEVLNINYITYIFKYGYLQTPYQVVISTKTANVKD